MIYVNEPNDGWDAIERMFLREIVLSIYRNIICPVEIVQNNSLERHKKAVSDLQNAFIFMAINESGYTQEEIASIFGISQEAIQKRLKNTTHKVRKRGL